MKQFLHNNQSGQTLIETIVAIGVLTTALVAGLSLSIYVLSVSALNQDQIIGTNLAREGVEVVRYMRDTNWLEGDSKGSPFALQTCSDINASCYTGWLTGPSGSGYHNYDLSQSNNANRWVLRFSPESNAWALENSSNFPLYLQSSGAYTPDPNGDSRFSRKILVSYCNTPTAGCTQYSVNNPQVIIQSIVGWHDKRCNWAGTDPVNAPSNCKVTIEERLTNWKDYQ